MDGDARPGLEQLRSLPSEVNAIACGDVLLCSACRRLAKPETFSKAQLKKRGARRCIECVAHPPANPDLLVTTAVAKYCSFCGETGELLRCEKCASAMLAKPAYYCSTACQEQDWLTHKRVHERHREADRHGGIANGNISREVDQLLAQWDVDGADAPPPLCAAGWAAIGCKDFRRATKLFLRSAQEEEPDSRCHGGLIVAFKASGNLTMTARACLRVVEFELEKSLGIRPGRPHMGQLAYAAADAIQIIYMGKALPISEWPPWMKNGSKLMLLSETLLKELGHKDPRVWTARLLAFSLLGKISERCTKRAGVLLMDENRGSLERKLKRMSRQGGIAPCPGCSQAVFCMCEISVAARAESEAENLELLSSDWKEDWDGKGISWDNSTIEMMPESAWDALP